MKFGQYLNENLTPEWRRAYIDYRACKKAIKVVARRLGRLQEEEHESAEGDDPEALQNDGANDSSGDDDYGPSAPPRKSPLASSSKSSRGGRSGFGSGQTSLRSPNVAGGSTLTPPTPATVKKKSPHYGSMTSTPRPLQRLDSIPPPLDLGEPGAPTTDESSPELKTSNQSTKITTPMSPAHVATVPTPKRNVAFKSQSADEAIQAGGRGFDTSADPGAAPLASSPELRSSEEGHATDSSSKPINGEAGPSRSRSNTRTKLSPSLGMSPRFDAVFSKSPRSAPRSGPRSLRSLTLPSPRLPLPSPRLAPRTADSFTDLYDDLENDEQAFFNLLLRELDKVETFYINREKEAVRRNIDLKDQLTVLAEHRKIYHELYPEGLTEWEASLGRIVPGARGPVTFGHKAAQKLHLRIPFTRSETMLDAKAKTADQKPSPKINGNQDGRMDEDLNALREAMIADKDHKTYSPERYTKHKRELRSACQDFYRHLERIKNYRIMNMTGFRKALKKFEKTTKIHCMDLWTEEHLSKAAFSKGDMVDDLLKQMEDLYTLHFEHGDSKKARDKLRRQDRDNTHYTTVFRSGFMIGIGLPAAIFALVEALNNQVHEDLPAWDGLLQVYGALFLPVIFALLFELNLDAWVSARINYEFVMELSRPVLDFRSYLEIPAFLFATLSFCFYFTYFRVGASNIAPSSWPAIWLVMVAVFFLNPLPVLRRDARFWFLRVLARVCTPGISRVEFIAFFIADELNSLVYTVQNIFFLSCGYANRWPSDIFSVCPSGQSWPYALLLSLPALARLLQCVKRWHDTRLRIHLVNAGKYFSSICQFIMFVLWRSRGSPYVDPAFFVWIAVAFVNSCYTSSWDLVVDWSLFRPGCKGLRAELGYGNKALYYTAMVYNVVIRFVWIWYLPYAGRYTRIRSFGFAMAEMLRRWIWNFFRVETEHLGNADAYRVTREIPLPYRRIEHDSDSDEPLQRTRSSSQTQGFSVHLAKLRRRIVDEGDAVAPTEGQGTVKSGYRQRPYEAWKPGEQQARNEV